MKYSYLCNSCVERLVEKPIKSMTIAEYNAAAAKLVVIIDHSINEDPDVKCGTCQSSMRRIPMPHSAYVRGYGLTDKKGAKNDMNLHQMVTGNDPYAEHRKPSESGDVINKLRKQKDRNPRARSVFLRK